MKVKVYFDNENQRYKIYNGDTVINAGDVVINEISIDSDLSDTSANAVENRAVKIALDNNKEYSQEIVNALNDKVDANKVDSDNKISDLRTDTQREVDTINSRVDEVIGQGLRLIKGTDFSWEWDTSVGNSNNFQLPADTVVFISIPKECMFDILLNDVIYYSFGDIDATENQIGMFVTGSDITSSDNFSLYTTVNNINIEALVEANTTLFINDSPQELKDIRVDYYGNVWDSAGDSVRSIIPALTPTILNPEYVIGDEVTYDEVGTGLINHNNGQMSQSNYHKKKAVSVGEAYEVTGRTYNNNISYSAITYLDNNGNVINYYPKGATEGSVYLNDYIVFITDPNIAYIVVNGDSNNQVKIRSVETLKLSKSIEKRIFNFVDKPAIKGASELATAENGLFNCSNKNIEHADNPIYTHAEISVEDRETYHISGATINYANNYRLITLLDTNGNVIETYPKEPIATQTQKYYDFKYTINNPKASQLIINGYDGVLSITKATSVTVEEYVGGEVSKVDTGYLTNFINMADMIKRVRAGGKTFNWGTFDSGYITIVFDDGRSDISTVASIFDEYNIPLCVAIPPSTLTSATDDNRTVKQVCQDIVSNGGEVLAHEFNPLTSATDYENIKRIVMNSKEKLVNAGFNVRGLIKVGGTGAIDWQGNNLQRFTQMFYDYSVGCGDDPQYIMERNSLSLSISSLKNILNDVATNNKWKVFFGHTIAGTEGELTEAHLREFIEYALEKGIEVKTYAYMYDNFGTWE